MRDRKHAEGRTRHPPGATGVRGRRRFAHHGAGGECIIRKAASEWLYHGHGFDAVTGLAEMAARVNA
jgi:hypothetical protein